MNQPIYETHMVYCRQCGNEFELQKMCYVTKEDDGARTGICHRCDQVRADYGFYDDVDEYEIEREEYYYSHGYCKTCGAEYGDGWSMCGCYDDYEDNDLPCRWQPGTDPECTAPAWPPASVAVLVVVAVGLLVWLVARK